MGVRGSILLPQLRRFKASHCVYSKKMLSLLLDHISQTSIVSNLNQNSTIHLSLSPSLHWLCFRLVKERGTILTSWPGSRHVSHILTLFSIKNYYHIHIWNGTDPVAASTKRRELSVGWHDSSKTKSELNHMPWLSILEVIQFDWWILIVSPPLTPAA